MIRTVGAKFYKIAPMDAFSAQLASAIVVMTASLTGGPVSASQVISSAIMGVGAAERPNKVRWKIAQDIGTAWLLTIPATALIAALVLQVADPEHPMNISENGQQRPVIKNFIKGKGSQHDTRPHCRDYFGALFDFLNGIHDSSNVVATMISSRAFSPQVALGVTALAEFSGPFIFGVAVAQTIGNGIVASSLISTKVILVALVSAILWDLLTWYLGFPSSSSHALIGGLIGAVVMAAGWKAIELPGLEKTLISLFSSPIIGFVVGFLFIRLILILSWKASPRINGFFKRSQILTGITLALSHGANDAQKTMGVITLALVTSGYLKVFAVPQWVVLLCASMIALGTSIGGWRLIRTLGGKIYKIRPVDGFASQLELGGGHPGQLLARRTGQHHPGGQLGDHGRGGRRTGQQGALGGGTGDRHGLAVHHPGNRPVCRRIVLGDHADHSLIEVGRKLHDPLVSYKRHPCFMQFFCLKVDLVHKGFPS